ncbi:MAG TPA: type II secretion system protein N [Allosphingosinicella sp.]|nr:type II secretion system protein N [Allosphingosinicella sp.]
MRFRLPLDRTVFFLAVFAFSMVALIPLRLAAGWFGGGLAAREASGSIWLGVLKEAQFGPVPLGDLDARLNVLPLLLGQARLSLSRDEAHGGRFEGAITVSRHSFALEDMTGQLRTGALLAPIPIAAFDLDDVSARFADQLCESAEGRVRVALAGEIGGVALPGGLAGDVRCAEGALLLPLASPAGQLNLSVRADGRYRIDLVIRQTDPSLAPRLAAAGFRPSAEGYSRRIEGSF